MGYAGSRVSRGCPPGAGGNRIDLYNYESIFLCIRFVFVSSRRESKINKTRSSHHMFHIFSVCLFFAFLLPLPAERDSFISRRYQCIDRKWVKSPGTDDKAAAYPVRESQAFELRLQVFELAHAKIDFKASENDSSVPPPFPCLSSEAFIGSDAEDSHS